jgi:hypothetical protein
MTDNRLRRLQWAVRATLTLGVAASVTANILHARPNPVSQAIAAWPPLALLITVELVSRIPVYRKELGAVRVIATSAIAGIAAWVSYHHMASVVARYGETGTVPYLLPLSVDGLIVVASVSLVELAGRRREAMPDTVSGEAPAAPARSRAAPAAVVPQREPAGPAELVPVGGGVLPDASPQPPAASEPNEAPLPARDSDHRGDSAPVPDPGLGDDDDTDPEPDPEDDADDYGLDSDPDGNAGEDLAADLVPLLPAACAARDELVHEGRTVSRDALARRMRRNGHSIRNNRVSELLAALRHEAPSVNAAVPRQRCDPRARTRTRQDSEETQRG